jgi:thymidylate synthase (FAD)
MTIDEQKVNILDYGYVQLIDFMGSDEAIIANARMSTSGAFKGWGPIHDIKCPMNPMYEVFTDVGNPCVCTPKPGDEKLLNYLWKNGHHSPFECCSFTVEIQAPIFFFRQLFRHRSLCPNEYSGRYTEMLDVCYMPTIDRLMMGSDGKNKQAGTIKDADILTIENAQLFIDKLEALYKANMEVYDWALKAGVPKELARIHLPLSIYSRARISGNLRNWLHCIELRSDHGVHGTQAQWETRMFINEVANIVQNLYPRTFEVYKNNH